MRILPYFVVVGVLLAAGFFVLQRNDKSRLVFDKKQDCSQYSDMANEKIKASGRVFESEGYKLDHIFYAPKMNTCLYAYTIHASFDPKEIYSIDDIFGGSVFTGTNDGEFQDKITSLAKE